MCIHPEDTICVCCSSWLPLLLVELLMFLCGNPMPPVHSEGFSAAGRLAFVTTAFHVTTHHLLPTFLYILSKTSVPPPRPPSHPFLPSLIIIPLTPYSFASSLYCNTCCPTMAAIHLFLIFFFGIVI